MSNLLQVRASLASLTQSIFMSLSNIGLSEDQLDVVQDHCDSLIQIANDATKDAVQEVITSVSVDRKARRKDEKKKEKDAKDKADKDAKDKAAADKAAALKSVKKTEKEAESK